MKNILLLATALLFFVLTSYPNKELREQADRAFQKAEKSFENLNHIRSLECFKKARYRYELLDDDNMQAKALTYIGFSYFRLGMHPEANIRFNLAVDLFDDIQSKDLFTYGQALSMVGKYNRSNKLLIQIDNVKALNWIGYNYRKLGNLDSAFIYHSMALELDPKKLWAYQGIGFIYQAMGEYEKSLEQFNLALLLADSMSAYSISTKMAKVSMLQKDWNGAIKYLLSTKAPPGGNPNEIKKNNILLKEAYANQRFAFIEVTIAIGFVVCILLIAMVLYHSKSIYKHNKLINGIVLRLDSMLILLTFAKDNVTYERKDQAIKDIEMVERIGREAKDRAC